MWRILCDGHPVASGGWDAPELSERTRAVRQVGPSTEVGVYTRMVDVFG